MTKHEISKEQLAVSVKIWIEDGILRVIYLKGAEITLELKKEQHRQYKDLIGEKNIPMMLQMEDGVSITKEAREFSRKIEDLQPFNSCAVVVNNLAYKILANFYARFYRPKKPFRVFDDVNKAKIWLEQFK